jgi:glucosamine-phosphate N-acetyltransferase
MDFRIRELQPGDVSRCLIETLSNLAEVGLTPNEAEDIVRQRVSSGVRTYVACDPTSTEVVGTVTLMLERKLIHRGGKVGHIEDVAVRKGFRGKGIASSLVRHATEEARKLGCYKVILNCFEQVVPLYASLGFRRLDVGMRIDLR